MNDLDKRLSEVGERWRETQREPPLIDPAMFVDSERPRFAVLLPLTRAAAVLVVVALGVVAVDQAIAPSRTGSQARTEPTITSSGDNVLATGVVVAGRDGVVQICDPLMTRLVKLEDEQPIQCSAVAVLVHGLNLSTLPGWTERGGGGFSDPVTVRGIWTGDAIEAKDAGAGSVESAPQPQIPCTTPNGGWPAPPSTELDLETALTRLTDELAAQPAQYSGYWVASAANGAGADRIAVVGAVDDPDAARTVLESVYPYALCVTKVKYSSTDLERAADNIGQDLQSRPTGSWRTRVSQQLNRVIVRTYVVDRDLVQLLDTYPEATADPLVRAADAL